MDDLLGPPDEVVDAVVVGAGVAGMYMVHRLRGLGLSVQGFEAGSDVGGTWYWNRYPGARCDVLSVDYSYSFSGELQQEWDWSERYATQAEILAYLEHVADRYGLRRSFAFDTRVVAARLDEATLRWRVRTDTGRTLDARFFILATGSLSSASVPDIPGLDDFAGDWYHTGQWPHEGVDCAGRRIGVIGTGSSGIQSIPVLAEAAEHLFVFQRTPNYTVPARNRPLSDAERAEIKANYDDRRRRSRASGGGSVHEPYPKSALEVSEDERRAIYEEGWKAGGVLFAKTFPDQLTTLEANETARAFVAAKIRAVVKDQAVADLLVPNDHPIGTKRICTDSYYFETFNRDNVTLVDVRSAPIVAITPEGIRTTEADYALDTIVFATGFDAMTGSVLRIDIRGRGSVALADVWAGGPRTYLGLSISGFPNLFVMTGPGSPSVLANMILAAEHHADWITECIAYLKSIEALAIEATEKAQDDWVAYSNELAEQTLFPATNSWYVGANIPGKPRTFMPFIGGLGTYRTICAGIAERNYEGFRVVAAT